MFLGVDKEVNLVINNNENDDVFKVAEEIYNKYQEVIKREEFAYTE